MAQIFVESIFEKHVDWMKLIGTNDNYKNQLQVCIQKEFKTTPDYLEISHDLEEGYHMGVYLCLGQPIWKMETSNAVDFETIGSFEKIQSILSEDEKVFVLLGSGLHKIKKKAEQEACEKALQLILN